MNNSLAHQIANNLKRIRKQKSLSQIQVADQAGIHFTYYSQIERAVRKDVSVRILKQIADALEVTMNEVVY